MKELKILESWADSIIANEAVQDRPLGRSQDIQYQASRKYPDRSPEQALNLFMADKMASSDKMDLDQNKLINAQKRENEKLRRTVNDIGRELDALERQEAETDREVARLRDLSAKLRPAGEVQQMAAKASADKVQSMLTDLENLQNKPGIDDRKYQELSDKINKIKSGPIDNKDVADVQAALVALGERQNIDDQLFDKVMNRLEQTETQLQKKEERFQKSIRKNAEKIGQWGNKFTDLDSKVKDIESRAKEVLDNVETENDNLQDKFNRLADLIYKLNPDVLRQAGITAGQLASTVADKQEKDEADLAKIQPEPVDPEEMMAARLQAQTDSPQMDIDDMDKVEPFSQEEKSNVISLFRNQGKNTSLSNDMKDTMNQEPRKIKEQQDLNIQMQEPPDYIEDTVLPHLIRWYRNLYPLDLKQYSVEQLKVIIRKTVNGGLLIYGDDITDKTIDEYLSRVRRWLRKARPVTPQLPGMPEEPPISPQGIKESLFRDFTKNLDRITGGY